MTISENLKKFNKEYQCTKISKSDVSKKIYGTSMGTKNNFSDECC